MRHLTPTETQQFLHAVPEALFVAVRSAIGWRVDGLPWEQS